MFNVIANSPGFQCQERCQMSFYLVRNTQRKSSGQSRLRKRQERKVRAETDTINRDGAVESAGERTWHQRLWSCNSGHRPVCVGEVSNVLGPRVGPGWAGVLTYISHRRRWECSTCQVSVKLRAMTSSCVGSELHYIQDFLSICVNTDCEYYVHRR